MPYIDGKLTPEDSNELWAAELIKFICTKSSDKEITYSEVEQILRYTLTTLKDHPMLGPTLENRNLESQPVICFIAK